MGPHASMIASSNVLKISLVQSPSQGSAWWSIVTVSLLVESSLLNCVWRYEVNASATTFASWFGTRRRDKATFASLGMMVALSGPEVWKR